MPPKGPVSRPLSLARLHEVFNACYGELVNRGLKEHVPGLKGVGHGLGLEVHEPPSIIRGSDTVIQPGMVLTVEPIFWDQPDHRTGKYAIEDNILVTEDAHEVMSTFSKELFVVD